MKTRLTACILFLAISFTAYAQPTLQQKAIVLKRMIELNHVSPRLVNDEFSKDIFESFIKDLDEEKVFFTLQDVDFLSRYKTVLDDELQGKGWAFFNAASSLYKKRLQQVDSLINQIAQKPFDFSTPDKVLANFDTTIAKNDTELKTRWYKLLKLDVLDGLSSVAAAQLGKAGVINKTEVFAKEPELRKKIAQRHRQKIKNILSDQFDDLCMEKFLSSISSCFDPHTSYFDLAAKREFQTGLNTEGYYFGFGLKDNDKNEVAINSLMPGSPAWKCGQLNKDDVVIQLQWEGEAPLELFGFSARDADQAIRDAKSNKLTLTVRKANGTIVSVPLQKERVENEGQSIKSFILSGKQKIGYIYLPGFYTSWEDASGSSCAEDMAREIVKLKKDGIEGIILDVRFNGGGSLQEAVELSGIFIDEGPLCLLKSKTGKTTTLRDMNRGTIWDGPLLMLVNGQSASASEMVAAVLQDYNRALIVGGKTFGKATAQQIIPIDTTRTSAYAQNSDYGFVKITNGRIYRVTGSSVQGRGVEPHITLPDKYNRDEWHEAYMPFSLKPDTVKGNGYYKPLAAVSYESLKKLSIARISANKRFQQLMEWEEASLSDRDFKDMSLKWDDVEKSIKEQFKSNQQREKVLDETTAAYHVENHSSDKAATKSETSEEWNKRWFDRLAKDLYVEESYFILSDLIQTPGK